MCKRAGKGIGLLGAAVLIAGGATQAQAQFFEDFNSIESGTPLREVDGWEQSDAGTWAVTDQAGYTGNGVMISSQHVYKRMLTGSEVLSNVPSDILEIKIMPVSVDENTLTRPWIYVADNSPGDPNTDAQTNGIGLVFFGGNTQQPDPDVPIPGSNIRFVTGGTSWWNAETPSEAIIQDSEGNPVLWKKQTWYTVQIHNVLGNSPTVSIFETDTQNIIVNGVPAMRFGAGPIAQVDHIGLREHTAAIRNTYYDDIKLMQRLGGDANLDGVVNISDLSILAANWQQSGRHWIHGDFTGTGVVDISDLSTLAGNWQQSVFGTADGRMSFEEAMAMFDVFGGVKVPEPATLGLLAMAGLLALRRQRT